jgi:MFS family permease
MATVDKPDEPQGASRAASVLRGADRVIGFPERITFSLFGHLLPATGAAVLRRAKFQRLLGAKFLADAGKDSVKYAALVGVIYAGGDAFASSLIGLASLIPAVIFALYGGAISDSMPKRIALAMAYTAMAAACILLPTLFDDSVLMYFMLVFIVISLAQVTSPAEQTLLPMVNTEEQLATANSVMGMVSSIGTTVGTAILAPILLLAWGTDAVFYTAAGLLLIAMTRIFQVDAPQDVERGKRRRPPGNFTTAARWVLQNPSILTMIAVSAIGGMGYQIMSTLAPTYVFEVLDLDPAKTIYVMGVAGFGMLLSLFFVPPLIARSSERKVAGAGFVMLTAGIVGLGLVNSGLLDFLTPINPVHWLDELFKRGDISEATELAVLMSFPAGFGMGFVDNSVKTFLNRRVRTTDQGRTFAIRNLSESALTVVPLLVVAAIATVTSVSAVFVVMPLIFYIAVMALLQASVRLGSEIPAERRGTIKTFWEDTDTEEITVMDDDADEVQAPSS